MRIGPAFSATLSRSPNPETCLLMRGPAGDQGDWAKDAKALVDAGAAAYKAARAKDTRALLAVDQPINASCVNCHKQYRFNNSSAPIAAPPHP